MNLGKYAKFIAAAIGAVVTVGSNILAQHYVSGSAEHWVTAAVKAAGILGTLLSIYGVPNKPQPLSDDLSALDPAVLAQALPPFGLHPLAETLPTANTVQTFTSGVIVPLAVAPESVGNAWDNAVAAYPGLKERLEKNAPGHTANGLPFSPEQYAARTLAVYFKLPH